MQAVAATPARPAISLAQPPCACYALKMTTFEDIPVQARLFATVMLVVASVGFGSVAYFARSLTDAGIAPPVIAFFRYIIPAFGFLPFLVLRGPLRRATIWGIGTGVIMGLGWIGYIRAIEALPVATAGVLYMTYPMFTVAFGWLVFSERPSARAVIAALLILVAAAMASGRAAFGGDLELGAALWALSAPSSMGLAIVILTHRLVALPPLSRMTSVSLGAVLGLLPLILTYPVAAVIPSDAWQWGLLIALSLAGALVPQLLFVHYAPKIGAAGAAAASAFELPTMFLIAWLAFGEALTTAQGIAGALVISAIVLTQSRRARNVTTHIATDRIDPG